MFNLLKTHLACLAKLHFKKRGKSPVANQSNIYVGTHIEMTFCCLRFSSSLLTIMFIYFCMH